MKVYTIYKVTNNINNKLYIGYTSYTAEQRLLGHLRDAKYKKGDSHFHNALRKHGIDNFSVEEIYQSLDKDHTLNTMEPYFITEFNTFLGNGYNSKEGGGGYGNRHSAEIRKKISKNCKGKNKGQIAWNKGKAMSAIHKAKAVEGQEQYRIANPDWYEKSFGNPAIREKREAKRLAVICKPVCVDGTIYPSATATAKALGLKKITLIKRVLSKNFESYGYLSTT